MVNCWFFSSGVLSSFAFQFQAGVSIIISYCKYTKKSIYIVIDIKSSIQLGNKINRFAEEGTKER